MPEELPESPFTDAFTTNHSATLSERAQILGLLEKPQERLKQMNSEISRLKQQVEALVAQRTVIYKFIRAHRALLAPIRRLPVEVLSEIFLFCLPVDRNPVRSVKEAPLLLTRICRRWRDIALENPRLWTGIHIFVPDIYNMPKDERRRIFEMRTAGWEAWLKRSGALPVSLSLHVSFNDNPMAVLYGLHGAGGISSAANASALEYYSDFARVLMALSKRWKNLTLHIPASMLTVLASTLKPEDVPLLERLQLSYRPPFETFSMDNSNENKFLFSHLRMLQTPSLQRLSLTSHLDSPYTVPVQWSNLTELNLQSRFYRGTIKLSECFGILSRACNLRHCSIAVGLSLPLLLSAENPFLQPTDPADAELMVELGSGKIIQLANLESLDLTFILVPSQPATHALAPLPEDLSYLFDHLQAPRLSSLRYYIGTSFYGTSFQRLPFLDFLFRSASVDSTCISMIEKLELSMPISDEGLKKGLEVMPELKVLAVNEWPVRPSRRSEEEEAEEDESEVLTQATTVSDGLVQALTKRCPVITDSEEENSLGAIETPDVLLCPKLEDVKFTNCVSGRSLLESTLIQFAESRWPSNPTIPPPSVDSSPSTSALSTPRPSSPLDSLEPPISRLKSLHIAFGHVSGARKNQLHDWATLKKRVAALMREGMKINWVYPGKRKVNDSPWGGLGSGNS